MSYEEQVLAITSNGNVFANAISENSGIVFIVFLILVTLGVAVNSGIKNGLILYLIAVLIAVIGVIIGAVSSIMLVYLSLPPVFLIVIAIVMRGRGE